VRVIRRSWWAATLTGGALVVAAGFPVAVQASGSQPTSRAAGPVVRAVGAMPLAGHLLAGLHAPAAAQAGPSLTALDGVFCPSTRDCWAVGAREAPSGTAVLNQMLHWNGKSWRNTSVPSPAGSAAGALSELFAVRCLDPGNCWTVGEDSKNEDVTTLNQALHWNGKKWSLVHTPNPAGTKANDNNELFDVTCTSAASCWSVGDFGTPFSSTGHQKLLNQVLHWNGKNWSRVRVPNPGGTTMAHLNSLFSVRCGSSTNCNAAGDEGTSQASTDKMYNQVLHWNGKRWSKASTPNPGPSGFGRTSQIDALACGSATDCWGVGDYGTSSPAQTLKNEILHWNGKKWSRSTVTNPAGDDNFFFGATCQSGRNCWAVGSQGNGEPGSLLNQTAHWNGKRWALVHTPNPFGPVTGGENSLLAARCATATDCWAVGYKMSTIGHYRNEILHWNGTKWSVVTAPGT
jgi:hypothetical protein